MASNTSNGSGIGWDRLQEIAFGWLNIPVADFEVMTFHQFNCKLKGWQELREADRRERMDMERTQLNALWAALQWKGQRPDAFQSFPMPWDPKPQLQTEESEWEQAARRYKFLKLRPNVQFNRDIMALIKKHRAELEKQFGPINRA